MKEYQLKTKMKSYQWDELSEEQRIKQFSGES